MHDEVGAEDEIGETDQQLPDHVAGSMSAKGEHKVDHASQGDEPGNDHVDGNGGQERRSNRQYAEDDQQKAPYDGQGGSLAHDIGGSVLCHGDLLRKADLSYLKKANW